MTCDFCGLTFEVESSRDGCTACSAWGGGCKFVKCPRCAYEMPELPSLPGWVKRLKSFLAPTEASDERDASGHAPS